MPVATRRTAPAFLVLLATCLAPSAARAARPEPSIAAEKPDPATVQRYGPAYRYPRAGWIVLHIEGAPYDRGYQHGRLLAPEIADYARTLATKRSHAAPADAWRETRTTVNALFLRRYDPEYLEEMKGTADGAAAAGATLFGRPVDLLDVVTINSDIELEFLDAALDATPTGLEGRTFREPADHGRTPTPPEHCSAFAAAGPATGDGSIVFGHITMFSLTFVRHFNVWLDVKPDKGHRVMMQTYPGGIQSGMDYYLNDAGLLVAETTIQQTRFDANGQALASRIRKALQYADSIDQAVATLKEGNNGMYTNEWLLADTKTNEIAMFELGTRRSKLWRSSRGEWFGGTKGFYWGCNNAKDLDVRLETIPGTTARPANLVWRPTDRDRTWLRLHDKHGGRIGEAFGFEAFTTPPLAAFPSCDAKFTTTALARELKTWALFGPPLGKTWEPSDAERKRFPDAQPLVGNDWTILSAAPPPGATPAKKVARADGPNAVRQRRIEELKAIRAAQQTEIDTQRAGLRELMQAFPPGDGVATDRRAATLDGYRRWSDELRNVEIHRIEARARLDQLSKGRGAPADGAASHDRLTDAFHADPRVAALSTDLDRAQAKLDQLRRITRSPADPAVVMASARLKELTSKRDELYRSLPPAPGRRLAPEQADAAVRVEAAESELAALTARQKMLEERLERLRIDTRTEDAALLKIEFARRDLERAEGVLDRIVQALAEEKNALLRTTSSEPPARKSDGACPAVDLPGAADLVKGKEDDDGPATVHPPAWHGTILPKSDPDTWLAASFADYQAIVARELALKKKAKDKGRELREDEKDEIEVALFAPFSRYRTAVVRHGKDVPLADVRADLRDDGWYQIAAGKGTLLLHALRERLGDRAFLDLMDDFGRSHAGKPVAAEEFVAAVRSRSREDLEPFFKGWLTSTGLPSGPRSGFWSIDSFEEEPEAAVIVYGTLKESDAQREAGARLQRQVERRWSNITVPVLSDREATPEAIKGRHLLLVGRPDTNSLAARLGGQVPVTFGPASFVARGATYAHPRSAVIVAGPRPDDPRHEVVLFAGLSAEATWRCVQVVGDRDGEPAEILVLPASGRARRLISHTERAADRSRPAE